MIPHIAEPNDATLQSALQARVDGKDKPPGSLGRLETLTAQLGCILGTRSPRLNQPRLVVLAADHGLAARLSASDLAVALVWVAFASGTAVLIAVWTGACSWTAALWVSLFALSALAACASAALCCARWLHRRIGRTDLGIDRLRAERWAHRIRHAARQQGLPRRVLISPLRRCVAVGQWLRRWGWQHERLPALLEMDLGRRDGLACSQIPRDEVDVGCAEFPHHRPGGGETLHELFARVATWQALAAAVVIMARAGWMPARRGLASAQPLPVRADRWSVASRHGEFWNLPAGCSSAGGIA